MHVIVHMHAIPPIWHTHWGKDKKQVQLELNMYFDKLMHTTTNTCLERSLDTMHRHVVSPVAPRKTMCMLSDELYRGVISVHPDATEARFRFCKMSPLSVRTPSRTTKLGIISPPWTITWISKSWSHHNGLSVNDVLHGLLKPFCLTWAHVHYNVTPCQVEVQVSIVECNSHRVLEDSRGQMNNLKGECQGSPHPFL